MSGPHTCPYCGRPAPKQTQRVSNPGKTDAERAAWVPERSVNGQIIRRDYRYPYVNSETTYGYFDRKAKPRWIDVVYVWDGETYRHGADPFCTSDHAYRFALAALRGGYRMIRTPEKGT